MGNKKKQKRGIGNGWKAEEKQKKRNMINILVEKGQFLYELKHFLL